MTDLVGRCIDADTEVPEFSYGNGMYDADIPAIVRAVIATIGAGLTREHVRTAQRAADEHFVSYADLNEGHRLNEIAAVIAVIVEAKA